MSDLKDLAVHWDAWRPVAAADAGAQLREVALSIEHIQPWRTTMSRESLPLLAARHSFAGYRTVIHRHARELDQIHSGVQRVRDDLARVLADAGLNAEVAQALLAYVGSPRFQCNK